MKLSVIVVSFNVKGYMSLCLDSALRAGRALGEGQFQLIVVDNASSDGSVDWVRSRHPEVEVLALEENLGFSAANNLGMAKAAGEWVLLLNPDTIVSEDTFAKVLAHVEGDGRIGGLGVPMFDGTGAWLPESKRGIPTPWASFCRLSGLWRLAPRSRRLNGYYFGHVESDSTADVEVLSGAFMWMRRQALDEVGLLDDTFFMYGEDIDLSVRLLKGGWVNRYYSEAPIVHFKGESTKKGSLSYVRVFHDAMRIFARKHFAGGQAVAMRWMIRLGIRVRAVSAFIHGLLARHVVSVMDLGSTALMSWGVIELHGHWAMMVHPWAPKMALVVLSVLSIWWSGMWFGSADRPFHRLRVLMAGIAASLSLLILYSLIPEYMRVSRLSVAMIALLMVGLPMVLREVLVLLRPPLFRWRPARPHVSIVSGASRRQGLSEWVRSAYGSSLDLTESGPAIEQEQLQVLDRCDMVLCDGANGGQASLDFIRLGALRGWDVRIVPEDMMLALGGTHREGAPTARLTWGSDGLGRSDRRRLKRRMDVLASMMVLLMGPGRGRFGAAFSRRNAWRVLRGKATWIGFHAGWTGDERLPGLPEGILHAGTGYRMDVPEEARRLDLRYASDFGWVRDAELLMNLRMD